MNYVQVDTQKFYMMTFFFGPIVGFPLLLVIGLGMLYNLVQWALIPGLLAIMLMNYLNWKLASKFFG